MRLPCNFINVYTICYRVHEYTRESLRLQYDETEDYIAIRMRKIKISRSIVSILAY